MITSIIVAMDKEHGIGQNDALPWAGRIPRDMKHFKEMTTGRTVIMGRRTFESIGKMLPNRMNIVLTRDRTWRAPGVWRVFTLTDAFALAQKESDEVFIIGGAELFREAMPFANHLYITEIDGMFACDTFFPKYDPTEWRQTASEVHPSDEHNKYGLRFLELNKKTA